MTDCPTVKQLVAGVKSLTRRDQGSFQTAWADSFIDAAHCCEQGGFIYVDFPVPASVQRAWITRAPKGSTMNQKTSGPNASIDLNYPGIHMNEVILVANFHTHPLSTKVGGGQQPSKADISNSFARGLPGIVISREGIYSYGPEMRESTENPKGYPPKSIPENTKQPQRVIPPVEGLPWKAPFQWDERLTTRSVTKFKVEGSEQAQTMGGNDAGDEESDSDPDVILVEWSDEDVVYHGSLTERED